MWFSLIYPKIDEKKTPHLSAKLYICASVNLNSSSGKSLASLQFYESTKGRGHNSGACGEEESEGEEKGREAVDWEAFACRVPITALVIVHYTDMFIQSVQTAR